MPVKVIVNKIEDVTADVIVNSLGIGDGLSTFGGICESIVTKANSKELEEKITTAKDIYTIGEFFVTNGYGLNCKHIINLVSPYYSDDKNLTIYKDCVAKVLVEAKRRGAKSIAIPKFGAGHNGYGAVSDKLDNIILEISKAFLAYFSLENEMTIYYVVAPNDVSSENNERLSDIAEQRIDIQKVVKKGSKVYSRIYFPASGVTYSEVDFEKNKKRKPILIATYNLEVSEYVHKFCDKTESSEVDLVKTRVNAYLGYRLADGKSSGSKQLSQMNCNSDIDSFYKIIFALRMSEKEATYFLNYFGKTFFIQGNNKRSDLVLELIRNGTYDLFEVNDEFKKNKVLPLLF